MNIYHILKSAEYFEKISTLALHKFAQLPTLPALNAPSSGSAPAGGTAPAGNQPSKGTIASDMSPDDLGYINAVLEYLGFSGRQLVQENDTWQKILSGGHLKRLEDKVKSSKLDVNFALKKARDSKEADMQLIKKLYIKVRAAKQAKSFEDFIQNNSTFQALKKFIDGYVQKSGNMREWGVEVYYTSMPMAPHSSNITVYTFPPDNSGSPKRKVAPLTTLVQKQFGELPKQQITRQFKDNVSQLIYKTEPEKGAKERTEVASEVLIDASQEVEFTKRLMQVFNYIDTYSKSLANILPEQYGQIPNFISSLNSYFEYYSRSTNEMIAVLQTELQELKAQFKKAGGDPNKIKEKFSLPSMSPDAYRKTVKNLTALQKAYLRVEYAIETYKKLLPLFDDARNKLSEMFQNQNADPTNNPFESNPLVQVLGGMKNEIGALHSSIPRKQE